MDRVVRRSIPNPRFPRSVRIRERITSWMNVKMCKQIRKKTESISIPIWLMNAQQKAKHRMIYTQIVNMEKYYSISFWPVSCCHQSWLCVLFRIELKQRKRARNMKHTHDAIEAWLRFTYRSTNLDACRCALGPDRRRLFAVSSCLISNDNYYEIVIPVLYSLFDVLSYGNSCIESHKWAT